jgi:hypothetical protein
MKIAVPVINSIISCSDIHELFSEFGNLKQATVHYDRYRTYFLSDIGIVDQCFFFV